MKKFTDNLDSNFGVNGLWLDPLHDCFEKIEKRMQFYVDENIRLREENEKLKSENYRDEELTRLAQKLRKTEESILRGFPIYSEEAEDIRRWKAEHIRKMHSNDPKNLARYWNKYSDFHYDFSPFQLGEIRRCYCESCRMRAQLEAKDDQEKYKKLLKKYDVEFDFSNI